MRAAQTAARLPVSEALEIFARDVQAQAPEGPGFATPIFKCCGGDHRNGPLRLLGSVDDKQQHGEARSREP
jgi:hypothetical protein